MGSSKYAILAICWCALLACQSSTAADKNAAADKNSANSTNPTNSADKAKTFDKLAKPAVAEKTYDGWRLKQTCIYQGDVDVTVCSFGVKITNPKNGLTTLFTAPYKIVRYYDVRTNLETSLPIENNDNPYQKTVAILDGFLLNDIPLHKVGKGDVAGLPATKYETTPEFAEKRMKNKSVTGENEAAFATYDVFNDIKADPLAEKFIAKFYGIPYKDGVPGFFKYKRISGKINRHVETMRCSKAKISSSEFTVPPNLKHAASSQAVLTGSDAYMMGL